YAHEADVDDVAAKEGYDAADHSRRVCVLHEQKGAFSRGQVDEEVADFDDVDAIDGDRRRHGGFAGGGIEVHADQVFVDAVVVAFALADPQAALLGDEIGVNQGDVLLADRGEEPFDHCRLERRHVEVSKLAQIFDLYAFELAGGELG